MAELSQRHLSVPWQGHAIAIVSTGKGLYGHRNINREIYGMHSLADVMCHSLVKDTTTFAHHDEDNYGGFPSPSLLNKATSDEDGPSMHA